MEETKIEITLNSLQYWKLSSVAKQLHRSPEEVAQDLLVGYLAIVEPIPGYEPKTDE